jgi:virginiamycin B lyase
MEDTMRRLCVSLIFFATLAGCGFHGVLPANPAAPAGGGPIIPQVVQKGGGGQWVTVHVNTLGALLGPIVTGTNGAMWFLDENAASLAQVAMGDRFHEFRVNGLNGNAVALTVGADGKYYINDETSSITRVTAGGVAVQIPIPSGDSTSITSNGLGPDGNVWFLEFNHVAKVTPAGVITEFAYPTQPNTNQYGGVTTGSDGNVWFTESSQNLIGRINPTTGKIKEFKIPQDCIPAAIVAAKDHDMWFGCLTTSPMVGRVTTAGAIKMFPGGGAFGSNETEQFGALGPDGNPWFASGNNNLIFNIDTTTHDVTTFTPPLQAGERPDALQTGPDGNIWVTVVGGQHIYVLIFNPLSVAPTKLNFTGIGQNKNLVVTENGTTSWTASSSNTAVATVAQGSPDSKFVVTSVGAGSCKVTIADANGNSVKVKVTVP